MNSVRHFGIIGASVTAAVMIAACNGGPGFGSVDSGAAPSHRAPDAKRVKKLLYVTTVYENGPFLGATGANFYSYRIGKLKGSLTISNGTESPVIPNSLCVTRHTVWFANIDTEAGALSEYAFGGTDPIARIASTTSGGFASCAYDLKSGRLAVVQATYLASGNPVPSEVLVYPNNGSGSPATYSLAPTGITTGDCAGYDRQGDLFVDGTTTSGSAVLAELPAGRSAFVPLRFADGNVFAPGAVQWDGKEMTITDVGSGGSIAHGTIYRLSIGTNTATITGSTAFGSAGDRFQPFIRDGIVVAACYLGASSSAIYFYHYPAGGSPIKSISVTGTVQSFNAAIITQ